MPVGRQRHEAVLAQGGEVDREIDGAEHRWAKLLQFWLFVITRGEAERAGQNICSARDLASATRALAEAVRKRGRGQLRIQGARGLAGCVGVARVPAELAIGGRLDVADLGVGARRCLEGSRQRLRRG